MTPAEMVREMTAAARILRRRRDEAAWLAWHIAALPRVKKFPKLKDMLGKAEPGARARQTPDQQLIQMKSMFLAFGGDPAELKKLQ